MAADAKVKAVVAVAADVNLENGIKNAWHNAGHFVF